MSEIPGQLEPIVEAGGRVAPLWFEYLSDPGAWKAYTPTVTPGSGAFTSVSATGRYRRVGKIVFFSVSVTITTNGTAAGNVSVSLPFTSGPANQIIAGREFSVAGKMLQGIIQAGGSSVAIVNYDNTYPGSNGAVLVVSGVCETK